MKGTTIPTGKRNWKRIEQVNRQVNIDIRKFRSAIHVGNLTICLPTRVCTLNVERRENRMSDLSDRTVWCLNEIATNDAAAVSLCWENRTNVIAPLRAIAHITGELKLSTQRERGSLVNVNYARETHKPIGNTSPYYNRSVPPNPRELPF